MSNFPLSAGLYLAQHGTEVVLIKITGRYPTLQLGKSVDISALISGGDVKPASKEQLSHMIAFPSNWKFQPLPSIDISVFPKTCFRPDGFVDIQYDELVNMQATYYRLIQQGIPYSDIMRALVYEYNLPMDQVRKLVNDFDKRA
jgi:hypothetical protein